MLSEEKAGKDIITAYDCIEISFLMGEGEDELRGFSHPPGREK